MLQLNDVLDFVKCRTIAFRTSVKYSVTSELVSVFEVRYQGASCIVILGLPLFLSQAR